MADPHAWAESFFARTDRFDATAVASPMDPFLDQTLVTRETITIRQH